MSTADERRPRTPGLVQAAILGVLMLLIALFAFTARQPPPPIAEFAPQSVENITDAPTDQSSSSGKGAGICAAGQACSRDATRGTRVTPATSAVLASSA